VLSRLSIEKGVDVLVRALPAILKEFPGLRCVVAGEGPERQRLLDLAAEIGVGGALELPGFCSDTSAFVASCSVMIHPSRIDGTPMAVLEAMAAHKTIVASAVGGIPSMLRQGAAGLLVPPEDPVRLAHDVLRVLHDPSLAQQLADEALQEAQRYDASVMARTYLELYAQQTGPGPARRPEAQPAEG
jgi:glycosyltransferase involved in cell wall biosynthesis